MKKIDTIIDESINSYIDSIIQEEKSEKKKEKSESKKSGSKSKKSKKDSTPTDKENAESTRGTEQFADFLEDLNDSGRLNIRKLASELTGIPTATDNKKNVDDLNAAQSALRKQIKGIEAPSGGHYRLDKKTASKISQVLSTL